MNRAANHLWAENDLMLGEGSLFTRLDSAIHSDPFSKQDSIQAYTYYSGKSDDEAVQNQVGLYAEEYTCPENSDPDYVAEFFFDHSVPESASASLSRHVAFNRARTSTWQYVRSPCWRSDDGSAKFRELAQELAVQMKEANRYLLQPVTLYGRAQTYFKSLA